MMIESCSLVRKRGGYTWNSIREGALAWSIFEPVS